MFLVSHHLREQTPEQAEPGSYWVGVSGKIYDSV